MSRNSITIRADPDAVFDVVDDACSYPGRVVGARRVRRVDDGWPETGSSFHHAIGTTVSELHDSSTVLHRDRPHQLSLEVRFRPLGVARVDIHVAAAGSGSVVTMVETPIDGPMDRIPSLIADPVLAVRNALSLQRLRHAVERSATTMSRTTESES